MTDISSSQSGSSGIAPDPAAEAPAVAQRHGRALLAWIQEPDVRPLFYSASVTSPDNVERFVDQCRSARDAKPSAAGGTHSQAALTELPTSLQAKAEVLQATDQFRMHYQPFGAVFVTVPLTDLVAPQWWVDTEYVDALAVNAPAEDDLEHMFDFSFATGKLARPMLLGTNGAAFASPLNDIGGLTPLRVARYSPDKVTFEFDVIPRPNWVWIAAVQDIGRLLILNGVHHLLALLKAGRQHAFCLARPVESVGDLQTMGWNAQDPALFKQAELGAARPPMLADYLDTHLVADIAVRLRQSFLHIGVGSNPGVIPRVD
jgi:hypothetical protein